MTHYSCLELLAQRPGLSNSELARGAFVTRQSMNVLLQALERDGYVTRPAEAPVGKVLPARLTPRGRRSLEKATAAVRSVEVRMLAGMTADEQSARSRILRSMIRFPARRQRRGAGRSPLDQIEYCRGVAPDLPGREVGIGGDLGLCIEDAHRPRVVGGPAGVAGRCEAGLGGLHLSRQGLGLWGRPGQLAEVCASSPADPPPVTGMSMCTTRSS